MPLLKCKLNLTGSLPWSANVYYVWAALRGNMESEQDSNGMRYLRLLVWVITCFIVEFAVLIPFVRQESATKVSFFRI